MVSLVRVLDLSPSGWSALEVTHNVGSFCLARTSLDHPQFCARLLRFVLSPRVSQVFKSRLKMFLTQCDLSRP